MINQLEISIDNIKYESDTGLITEVSYSITLIDTETKDYVQTSLNTILDTSSKTNIIPLQDLTDETVIGWIKNKLGETKLNNIKTFLSQKLENKKNKYIIKQSPPWREPKQDEKINEDAETVINDQERQ